MKLSIQTTEKKEIEIPVPSFYSKGDYYFRAVFSEDDYRQLFILNGRIALCLDSPGNNQQEIFEASQTWEQSSELEFITKMDEVLAAFSLTPTLKPFNF